MWWPEGIKSKVYFMRTFRKFLFILYSRRPNGRLLVNQEKIGIIDQEILAYS